MIIQSRPKLAQDIADYLSEQIVYLRLTPGERITEVDIATKFDVSHGPVREALQIMEKIHLVELVPRKGARVKEMTAEGIRCLFEAMMELACLAVRLCCKNATPLEKQRMEALSQNALAMIEENNVKGYVSAGYEVCLLILETACNHILTQMLLEWAPSARRAYYLSVANSVYNFQESAQFLRDVIASILENNAQKAQDLMRGHITMEQERIMILVQDLYATQAKAVV